MQCVCVMQKLLFKTQQCKDDNTQCHSSVALEINEQY